MTHIKIITIKSLCKLSLVFVLLANFSIAGGAISNNLTESEQDIARGDYRLAIKKLHQIFKLTSSHDNTQLIDISMLLSDAYRGVGEIDQAQRILRYAEQYLEKSTAQQKAIFYQRLGRIYLLQNNYIEADWNLREALDVLKEEPEKDTAILRANLQNDLGLVAVNWGKNNEAINPFLKSRQLAKKYAINNTFIMASINLAQVYLETDRNVSEIEDMLSQLENLLIKIGKSKFKAEQLIALGNLYRDTSRKVSPSTVGQSLEYEKILLKAYKVYKTAITLAKQLKDSRLESYGYGGLGSLYEQEKKYDEALYYSRLAMDSAQYAHTAESLFQWEWQLGRIFYAKKEIDKAIGSYKQAIKTLEPIRYKLTRASPSNYRKLIEPVYYELAELMLTQTNEPTIDNTDRLQEQLLEIRGYVERAKIAEIEDYFQDDCVIDTYESTKLEKVSPNTAVIYPVILQNRLEIIVSFNDNIKRFKPEKKVTRDKLTDTVRELRKRIEAIDESENSYLEYAQQLYDWIIRPVFPDQGTPDNEKTNKEKIDTLVFVPGGPLRTIPMSVLHNKNTGKFLVQTYAISTTLGLGLTNPRSLKYENMKVLAGGLSVERKYNGQLYDKLIYVDKEIEKIRALFNIIEPAPYVNEDFKLSNIEPELSLGKYRIVHIATHGEFNSDPRKSFLLTYNGQLTMNQLEKTVGMRRFSDEPLELLVLSACQTAAGDDRAALGLAGVAISAGARSALATLWAINDKSTSDLITNFYKNLKEEHMTKAQALSSAQSEMISNEQYAHPRYWAPFLLIGNWL